MISMHSWVFRLMLFMIGLMPAVAVVSGLGLVPVFLIIALPALSVCLFQKNHSTYAAGLGGMLAGFFIWALISTFWSPDLEDSLGAWVRVVLLLIIGFTFYKGICRMNEEQKRAIDRRLSLGMLLALLLIVFEMMTEVKAVTLLRNLIGGKDDAYDPTFLNRGLTFLALMYWPFALAMHRTLLFRHQLTRKNAVTLGVVLWVGTASLLLQLESLSATLAFFLSTLVFGVHWLGRNKLTLLMGVGAVACLASIPWIISVSPPERVMKEFQLSPSAEHRLYIWNFTAESARENPIAGWGFNSSPSIPGGDTLIQFDDGAQDDRKLLPAHPHNQVMQIWLELGYIGLGLFLLFVGYGFYALAMSHLPVAEKSAGMAAFSSYLIIGSLSYGVWQYWWLAAGLLCWCISRSTVSIDAHAQSRAIATN